MQNNLGLFIAKRAQMEPNREAIVDVAADKRYSYAEFNARCNRVGNGLVAQGVEKGDRVATLLLNGGPFIEAFFGIAKVGGVIVALNYRLLADELSFILLDSGAETLFFGTAFADVAAELQSRGWDGSAVKTWIHVGDAADRPDFAIAHEDILSAASEDEPETTAGGDDLLFIMYTSGTTGLPKGVMHSHETTMWASLTALVTADLRWDDRYLLCLPLFHVGALNPLISALHRGCTVVIMDQFDPLEVWQTYGEERINCTLAVPAMLNAMLQAYDADAHDTSDLRWVMSGAAPVPVALIEKYAAMGIEIHQVYGMTECCGPACLISPDEALARAGSTGKAFFHTEVKVVDPEGNPVAPGSTGEVWIRGPHVMLGYWNRPDATAETIVDGWIHSGDVAMIDADGFIYIQDRIKDMIISGGENVFPAEIENVLAGHDGIIEAAVVGQPSQRWGESPLAVVVRGSESLTEQDVLDFCHGKLAPFKLPQRVVFVDEIPRNPTGKVLKRVLREEFPGPAPA